jgi:hypothetical protein
VENIVTPCFKTTKIKQTKKEILRNRENKREDNSNNVSKVGKLMVERQLI